jgi:hypothetical protein
VVGVAPAKKKCGCRLLLDSFVKEQGGAWAAATGSGKGLEAETQFARRLIIGFGWAETNREWRDWGGGMP